MLNFFSSCPLVCVWVVFFFHFSVLEVASPLLKSCLKPLVHTRGSEWEGMCRVKLNDCLFRIVNPAPLYKANSAYLLCLSKKEKPHPLIATHTHDSLLGFLSHFVGLGVSMHSGSAHSSSPCYVSLHPPPSMNPGGKVGIKHTVRVVVVLWATKLLVKWNTPHWGQLTENQHGDS